MGESENVAERALVRDAITATWQSACAVRFVGWGKSVAGGPGIHILIADQASGCVALGQDLDGKQNGMVLNFTFANWCPDCGNDRAGSIRDIAIHEFGHALGLVHEQNRDDAPQGELGKCAELKQGEEGDWYVTDYDPQSIMNYCNPQWNNKGRLSDLDRLGVATIYGPP